MHERFWESVGKYRRGNRGNMPNTRNRTTTDHPGSPAPAQFRAARFMESRLTQSFAPTFLAARTTWRDVLIENPRWGSAEFFDSELNSVHIRGGKIDFLNLRTSRLTDLLSICEAPNTHSPTASMVCAGQQSTTTSSRYSPQSLPRNWAFESNDTH